MIGLVFFLLLIILICCFSYNSIGEGFALLGDESKKYKIPINVYIVNNMNVLVETNTIKKYINSWLSESEAKTILNKTNTKFYNNYNIEWVPKYQVVTIPNTDEAKEDMNKFTLNNREATNATKKKIFSSFFKHVPSPTKDTMSLYFITFLGQTQQGICVKSGSNAPYMLIGQYSNKPGQYNSSGEVKKRDIDNADGIPSLTFTVVHELAHALGLEHLNTDEPNVMNGTTSTFTANDGQIKDMQLVASSYAQQDEEVVQIDVPSETDGSDDLDKVEPSPSYSYYHNNTIRNTTALENTPGMLGGFCEQYKHSVLEIEKKCSTLGKDVCASTNCCVLLGNDTCVSGNERGPSYQYHYHNPIITNRDYYYYRGECYGNCNKD